MHYEFLGCHTYGANAFMLRHIFRLIVWAEYLQVLINGAPLGTPTRGISMKQLIDAVCKAYSGPQNVRCVCCTWQMALTLTVSFSFVLCCIAVVAGVVPTQAAT